MTYFHSEVFKIEVIIIFSIILSFFIIIFSYLVSSSNPDTEKVSTYECGFDPYEDARNVFDVRFYLIAIFFIVFDLEAVYFFP
jgi:NADH-quinone oxidoreductase subunit A